MKRLDEILKYLDANYNSDVPASLLIKVYEILDTLSIFTSIGSMEISSKNIRGIVISKYLKLFYRVEDNTIILLNFFDTRQNPNQQIR